MEPLRNPAGVDAARRAAEKTGRAMKEQDAEAKTQDGIGQVALGAAMVVFALPLRCAMKLIPWYKRSRAQLKVQVTHLLYVKCHNPTRGHRSPKRASRGCLVKTSLIMTTTKPQTDADR